MKPNTEYDDNEHVDEKVMIEEESIMYKSDHNSAQNLYNFMHDALYYEYYIYGSSFLCDKNKGLKTFCRFISQNN